MTVTELTAWAAAALTLLAFNSRDVRLLRLVSVGASVAFITCGAATSTWPVLALYCELLPSTCSGCSNCSAPSAACNRGACRARRTGSTRCPAATAGQASPALSCAWGRTPAKTSRRWPRFAVMTLAFISSDMRASAQATQAEHLHIRALASPRV